MLPSFYQKFLEKYLNQSQILTLKMLVWLLQSQKQVRIERLAATLPLPIEPIWHLLKHEVMLSPKRNPDTMPYSSSLTDQEWEVLEPLLLEILPQKKQTRPSNWTKRQILDGIFYQLKNGCNWQDLPKDLPSYSTVYWHYKQWREARVMGKLMTVLHEQVREQVKKKPSGRRCS